MIGSTPVLFAWSTGTSLKPANLRIPAFICVMIIFCCNSLWEVGWDPADQPGFVWQRCMGVEQPYLYIYISLYIYICALISNDTRTLAAPADGSWTNEACRWPQLLDIKNPPDWQKGLHMQESCDHGRSANTARWIKIFVGWNLSHPLLEVSYPCLPNPSTVPRKSSKRACVTLNAYESECLITVIAQRIDMASCTWFPTVPFQIP